MAINLLPFSETHNFKFKMEYRNFKLANGDYELTMENYKYMFNIRRFTVLRY